MSSLAVERVRALPAPVVLAVSLLLVVVGVLAAPASSQAAITVDRSVVTKQTAAAATIVSPALSTTGSNEVLLAFLASDGPTAAGSQTFATVTGGGLTWRLRRRANVQFGTAEIWQAVAPAPLTNATITARRGSGTAQGMLSVVAFLGVDPMIDGATAAANAATGGPSVSLLTTRAGGWVWGVGDDWDRATARTVGLGQTKGDELLAPAGDTFWTQRQTAPAGASGSSVTLNATAPTTDRWNLAAVELLPAGFDTDPPTAPTGLAAGAVTAGQVPLSWSASTDGFGVTGYRIFRDGAQVGDVAGTSFTDTTVSASNTYAYTVTAYDGAGNVSAASAPLSVTTPTPDTTAPSVSVTVPADGATVSGTTTLSAGATDNVGVVGVRFFVDGTAVGAEDTTTPYSVSWVTTTVADGTHSVTATARDAAGNATTSTAITAKVDNAPAPDATPPTVAVTAPADGATVSGTTTLTASATDNVGVVGVRFFVDGTAVGAEDTTVPYSVGWDTTAVADGTHAVTARARDAAGNATTSATVSPRVTNVVSGTDPAQVGQWGPVIDFPAVAIHSALTPDGKVLVFQGDFAVGGMQYVFDPATSSMTKVPDAAADLFCAGQAVLADGRIAIVGGTATKGGLGITDITAFDWRNRSWNVLAPMHYPRWYATATTLGDGNMFVISGSNQSLNDLVPIPEMYSPKDNTWRDLTAASNTMPYYPFIYQLPDGRIVHLGGSEYPTPSEVLDLTTNKWTTFDSRSIEGGSIANYAPGKFLKSGSASDSGFSGPSASTAFTLDMNAPGATWQPSGSMTSPRSFLNLTNLPDGTVLATGGETDKSGFSEANAVLAAENWDPGTGSWTKYAAMAKARLYHSTAVLLPDGRVYTAGGGGDPGVPDQKNAQIFSPPYLFKGARPTITSAPDTVKWNSHIAVGTPDGSSIRKVSLIRTGSVTHSFDQNARAVPLSFTQTAGGLDVQMPADGNTAPPGYYMLFIVNDKGVPSIASFVRFPAPYEDAQAPTKPAGLTAVGKVGAVDLSWSPATDDIGVARYDVYRSTTAGFTPSPATKVGQSTTTTFTDSGVPAGAYYYRVTAVDAAGNAGPPADQTSATVAGDTTPPTAPANLRGTAAGQAVNLTWDAATDDVGVTGYRVLRDGTQIGTATTTSYTDPGLAVSTPYTYTVVARDAAGNPSAASNPVTVTTGVTPALALDRTVTTRQSSAAATIASPALSTTQPGELLVAFLASDGPNGAGGQSFSSVTGGGLTWTLRRRTNAQAGTAEIWQARAPATLTNAVVTGTRAGGAAQGSMTVAAFIGAETTALGATGSASATTGAPTVALTTTRAGSWVWGVGDDWDRATARTVGPGQTMVDEFLAPAGDTFWVQRQSAPTPASGTSVTLNDTAPTTDRWNLAAMEILPG